MDNLFDSLALKFFHHIEQVSVYPHQFYTNEFSIAEVPDIKIKDAKL